MAEFDIDNLKENWQQQTGQNRYGKAEIIKMLNRRSSNDVQYIFWISLAEFLIFLLVDIFYLFGNNSSSFASIATRLGLRNSLEMQSSYEKFYLIFKILSLATSAFFVVLFFASFRKIKAELSLKSFILRIIQFRKAVNAFIISNILLAFIFSIGFGIFLQYNLTDQHITLEKPMLYTLIIVTILTLLASALLIWLYYLLVYGYIIRRLGRSLKKLQEIDQQAE